MNHLDLFSGIGGFTLAVENVWPNSKHIFCDNDKFCQQVLKKHWPKSKIYGDIREVIADASGKRKARLSVERKPNKKTTDISLGNIDIVTGGFPCQPFSSAGRRQSKSDDRYLWPEMLRVIQLTEPKWVVAENVGGILTINQGLVFDQVCADLEDAGYEVQPFVIPAVAVNAPHRRDRVWFVAHRHSNRGGAER